MAKVTISTPKRSRIDTRHRHEPKTRSGLSIFARTAANGTPTRPAMRGITGSQSTTTKLIAPAVRSRILKHADGINTAGRAGGKHTPAGRAGLALATKPNARVRGVSSLWKSGLELEDTRSLAGTFRAEADNGEGEGSGDDESTGEGNFLPEDSDVEWGDERTLIDGLMGFEDGPEQNKAKRQEILTDTLREHFSSLSVSIKQDLLEAVVPVIDNLATAVTLLQKGPDNDYKDGFVAFNEAAYENLSTGRAVNKELGELKDQSLTRLKRIVGKIEIERTKRADLCEAFKARYAEICSRAQDRLARLVSQDIEQASVAIENRANVIVNGKDKDKEKMRQNILKAFA